MSNTVNKNPQAILNIPSDVKINEDWQRLNHLNWCASDISELMYQTDISVDDDITLRVEAGGNPNHPPLLLIMGLGAQLIFWTDDFIARLIDNGFFVIRFDNRDIGLSSKIEASKLEPSKSSSEKDETKQEGKQGLARRDLYKAMGRFGLGLSNRDLPVRYTLEDMAEDTVKLIDTLGFRSVNVLGASMGGMIAQILASRYPHKVERLALLFTTNNRPFSRPPTPAQLKTLLSQPKSNQQADVINHGIDFIRSIGSPGFFNENSNRDLSKLRFERNYYPLGTARQFHAILATGSIRDYSRSITVPTLVMHGSEDGLVPTSHGRSLAVDIPNAKYVEITGMGHDLASYFLPFLVGQLKQFFQPMSSDE